MSSIPKIDISSGYVVDVVSKGAKDLFDARASDIRIQSDDYIFAYIDRVWVPVSSRRLDDGQVKLLISSFYKSQSGLGLLGEGRPLDFELTLQPDPNDPDVTIRCRANVTRCRVGNVADGASIILRTIPGLPVKWDDLNIEPEITDAFFPAQGLVIVIGVTGSGKSTLLSSSIRRRQETMQVPVAIGTFEDPVEYVYPRLSGGLMPEVSQVQVHTHLKEFGLVSPNILRRKFDVVVIGEMRDRQSVETGVMVADTGHATYATLHTETPATAFGRIISEFPYDAQPSIATKILENTRLIVAQKIVRTVEGKGLAFRSWCAIDRNLKEAMAERPHFDWSKMVRDRMRADKTTFEDRALGPYRQGVISLDTFMALASMNKREAEVYLEANS